MEISEKNMYLTLICLSLSIAQNPKHASRSDIRNKIKDGVAHNSDRSD